MVQTKFLWLRIWFHNQDPYGISKYAVELDLKAHEMFDLNYVILRPHNVYGERQNIADKYRNVIGIFYESGFAGSMTIFGDGLQTCLLSCGWRCTFDCSSLVPAAINQVFNVELIHHTILQLAEEIAEAFNKPPKVKHLDHVMK